MAFNLKLRLIFKYLAGLLILLILAVAAYEIYPERLPEGEIFRGYDGIGGEVRRTKGLAARFWYKGDLFATSDAFIFRSRDRGMTWEKVAVLGPAREGLVGWARYTIARSKLVRTFRDPAAVQLRILQDGTMLAGVGNIHRGRLQEGQITTLNKVHGGPGWLGQGWTEDREGVVYFGEYQLSGHTVTKLWCSRDQGQTWHILHEFSRAEIRHIHCVAYDPYRNLLWVTTGDEDHESRVYYSSDQGLTLKKLGAGSQDWRVVSLQFSNKAVYWGMDSEFKRHYKENALFKWNWDQGQREILFTSRDPFYYSANDGKGTLFFSTAAERGATGGTERGATGGTKFSELWMLRDGNLTRLLRWPKGNLDRHGLIEFAQGDPPPGWLAFTPFNLQGHHFETIVMQVN